MLTKEEKELSERDEDKSVSDLENELRLVQTPTFERFAMQISVFARFCVDECERQIEAEKVKGKEEEGGVKDEKKEKEGEDDEDDEEGDS